MPRAPIIPQQAQLGQAIDPQNFLLAAADLHQQGLLSDNPPGEALPAKPKRGKVKVVK